MTVKNSRSGSMQPFERDFFISRIRCGYLRFKVKDKVYIFTPPSKDIEYESLCVYKEYYEQSIEDGVITSEDAYKLLLNYNLWNDAEEHRLTKQIPEYLENAKVKIWQTFESKGDVEGVRKYINVVKDELVRIFEIRHQFDYLTCTGIGIYARWQFVVENCVKRADGVPIDWESESISDFLNAINMASISEEVIRELARTDPWGTIWSINKKNKNIFGTPSADLTEDQKRLISWSMVLDNVMEFENPPSDELIADDDCFDGYLINKRREQKGESDRDEVEKRMGKNAGASEVYILPHGPNDPPPLVELVKPIKYIAPETIFSMNDDLTKQIIKSRVSAIKEANGQSIKEADLPDVKLKNSMATVNR